MTENKVKVLLAEDDENLGSLLREYLQAKSYDTQWVTDGDKAFKSFEKNKFDICILDIMMPVKDGFTLAKEIRMLNRDIPIIFLTAKSMKEDVFEGFSIGADDYITKPFSMEELLYRMQAILRRTKGDVSKKQEIFNIGKYRFDTNKHLLILEDKELKLTTKESELLRLLCKNANQVMERNFDMRKKWIDENNYNTRRMDVYITKLRKYLKEDPSIEIMNIHGTGYKLIM